MRPRTVRSAQAPFPCGSPRRAARARLGQRGRASTLTCIPVTGLAVGLAAGLGIGVAASRLSDDEPSRPAPASASHTEGRAAASSRAARSALRSRPKVDARTRSRDAAARRAHVPASVAALEWDALAECESDGDPRATSPVGYFGLYQFDRETWRTVGGTGMPHRASPAEQTYRAQLLFLRRGRRPWPSCGGLL